MDSLGVFLLSRRESLGLTLEDIVRRTRIATQYLKAIEEEQWDELPPPVFAKGFIRAYCQALGEPPDEALRHYLEIQNQKQSPVLAPSWGGPPRPVSSTLSVSLTLVVVLGLSLAGVSFFLHKKPEQPAPRPAAQSVVPARQEPAPTPPASPPPSEPVAVASAVTPSESPRSRLVAKASELTWVKVATDDGNVFQELLQPGTVREWISSKRFVLTVGNAGGITLEYNGRPLPSLGPSGAVVHDFVVPGPNEAMKP